MLIPRSLRLAPLAACLLLAACATARAPRPPQEPPAPAQYKEADAAAPAVQVPQAWWQLFHDPVLDDLEQRVVLGNQNIQAAVAQMSNARALVTASQSAMYPTLNATLGGTRSAAATSSGTTAPANTVSLVANASWELDVWGRLSLAAQSAQTSALAAQADLAAARLSMQATLAQTYFALRSAEVQQALLERSVKAYQRALELTQARYQAGVAPLTDVLQATTQLNSAQTQRADTAAQRAQLEHAIAVLLGLAPAHFSLAPTGALPAAVSVPASLPAHLLQHRPDIAAAQLRVQAAYAQIGIADAAFYPALNLSASLGYGQSSLADLFSTPNLLWSLGASVTQSITDSGAHQLASDQSRASADQLTASYRQLVLSALQEVEDNLVLVQRLQEEVQSQTQAWQAAVRNLAIVSDQYAAGTVGYLNVSAAQSAALSSEISLWSIRTRELTAVNILLKNIGGTWEGAQSAQ